MGCLEFILIEELENSIDDLKQSTLADDFNTNLVSIHCYSQFLLVRVAHEELISASIWNVGNYDNAFFQNFLVALWYRPVNSGWNFQVPEKVRYLGDKNG